MLDFIMEICEKEYKFEEFEACRDFFKQLINNFRQMNYSEFNSESFRNYEEKIRNLVA